ncbi:MAG: STAS domain-containing protein [Pirellulales bacterium]|nr:STAS domain-containing protein [Pirellulales bacterium]
MALVNTEVKGEILVVILDVPRLVDQTIIDQCYRELAELLHKTEEEHVLLHFGRVAFMSSAALGMLIRLNKTCKEYKISLKLCDISSDIRQVFTITNLDKVFSIHTDAAEAMAAFKKSGGLFFRKNRPKRHELS